MCTSGERVEVWNGNSSKYLGEGTLVGFVSVFYIMNTDGSISSLPGAELKPEGIPDNLIDETTDNPKIVLDSGKVVYGCQVWWHAVEV